MTDLQEEPAVPPFDPQGDERAGYLAAGAVLVVLGWGLAVVANVLAHLWAPSGGWRILGVHFSPTLGAYAWAALGFGLVTGAIGIAVALVGRGTPKGKLVLPGYDY